MGPLTQQLFLQIARRSARGLAVFTATALLLSLTACAVTVGGVEEPSYPPSIAIDMMKPANEDYYGSPASFSGRWEGECSYRRPSGVLAHSCWVTLSLQQTYSTLAGSITYTVDGESDTLFLPQSHIEGNSLRTSIGDYNGRIGARALLMNSETWGDFTIRHMSDGRMALLIRYLPNEPYSPGSYRFSSMLRLTY